MPEIAIYHRPKANGQLERAGLDYDQITGIPLDWFFDGVGLMSQPPPMFVDPHGVSGIGYDHLPHPHEEFNQNNPTPELGDYVYPFDKLWSYFLLDGTPENITKTLIKQELKGLLAKHALPVVPADGAAWAEADKPRIAIVV